MSQVVEALPVANPTVVFRPIAEGAVLLSTTDEVYYGLNPVGTRVWELLPPACRTLDELCDQLSSEYRDVSPEIIRADVVELLRSLLAHGLVQPAAGAQAVA